MKKKSTFVPMLYGIPARTRVADRESRRRTLLHNSLGVVLLVQGGVAVAAEKGTELCDVLVWHADCDLRRKQVMSRPTSQVAEKGASLCENLP